MSLAIQRTPTRTGMRIHFDGCPESSKAPRFCEGHPFTERDYALALTFLRAPFGSEVARRWRVNGVLQDAPPPLNHYDAEDAAEAA